MTNCTAFVIIIDNSCRLSFGLICLFYLDIGRNSRHISYKIQRIEPIFQSLIGNSTFAIRLFVLWELLKFILLVFRRELLVHFTNLGL